MTPHSLLIYTFHCSRQPRCHLKPSELQRLAYTSTHYRTDSNQGTQLSGKGQSMCLHYIDGTYAKILHEK